MQSSFLALTEKIAEHEALGARLIACPCCGHKAAIEEQGFVPLYFCRCLVCSSKARYLRMACQCGASSPYDAAKHRLCGDCGKAFGYVDVVKQNQPSVCCSKPSRRHAGALAKCHVCEKLADSVYHFDEQYLCLSCLTEHRSPGSCEDCLTIQTGDLEDTFNEGCMECGGRVSWD